MSDNHEKVAARLGLEKTENGLSLTKQSLLAAIGGPLGVAEAI